MLLLLTERNLSFKIYPFFSDKEKVHLSAKRMILGASDRSVVAGTGFCSGCRKLLAGYASVGGGGVREGTWDGYAHPLLFPQERRYCRMTSLPVISSDSCSCFVRDTTQVGDLPPWMMRARK